MASKKKSKKEKTLNDLDLEFQWNVDLDPDHIFEEEYNLIKQLKKEIPALEEYSDKFILVFLIARRHDVADTVDLFKKFLKLQQDYGYSYTYPPSFSHDPLLSPLRNKLNFPPIIHPLGFRDKSDRMLRYYFMADDIPEERDVKALYPMMFWQTYFLIQMEPLSAWRNGIAIVADLKDFGWKNLDMSSKGRAANKDIQGVFPFRFRNFFTVNGGSIIGALIQAAKLVVPKKIMSRMTLIDPSELKDHIPAQYLLKRYESGEAEVTVEAWLREAIEQEEILFQKGIWKIKDASSPGGGASSPRGNASSPRGK